MFHRVVGDDDLQSSGIAEYLSSAERATAVAYVHDGSDYGRQLAVNTERKASAKGVRSAAMEAIDPKSGDFSAAIAKIRASGAGAVFFGGLFTEAALLKRRLVEQGANVRFISGEGALDKGFVDAASSVNAEGRGSRAPATFRWRPPLARSGTSSTTTSRRWGRTRGCTRRRGTTRPRS